MELISIIVPAYNVEKYIGKCIESILRQSYKYFELILIDDGSKDNTLSICKEYESIDARIRVYHKENGGLSEARNYGLDRFNGQYVCFIDSDDYVDSDYLRILYNGINIDSSISISVVKKQRLKCNDIPRNVKKNKWELLNAEQAISKILRQKGTSHTATDKLYKARLWRNHRFPVGKYYEDYLTIYNIVLDSQMIAFNSSELYFYIQRNDSIMHEGCSEKALSIFDVSDKVTNNIINTLPSIKIEAHELQIKTYLKYYQIILNSNIDSYKEYQRRIKKKISDLARELLLSRKVSFKTKFKIIMSYLNPHIFLFIYNKMDGNKQHN